MSLGGNLQTKQTWAPYFENMDKQQENIPRRSNAEEHPTEAGPMDDQEVTRKGTKKEEKERK